MPSGAKVQMTAAEAVAPHDCASPLWTLQLCTSNQMLQRHEADCEENRDPGQHHRSDACKQQGDEKEEGWPRSKECAVVLGHVKAKPSVAAEEAASLDMTCARLRQHPAVEARESLRRGQTREMDWKKALPRFAARSPTLRLHSALRLENGSGLSRISSTLQRRSWRPDVLRDVEADGCRSLHVVLLRIVVTSSATTSVALTRRVEEPSTASGAVILSLMRRPRIETEKSDVRGTSPFRRVQAGSCVLPLPRSG
jgi:hypothetical protein